MAATKLSAWLKGLLEPPHGVADSLVSQGVVVQGDLRVRGVFYFDGELRGHVEGEAGAMFVLTDNGVVHGDIRCPYVVLNGRVEGHVESTAHIQLQPRAKVSGNVYYHLLETQTGAEVGGHLIRRDERHAVLKEQPPLPLPAETHESGSAKDNS